MAVYRTVVRSLTFHSEQMNHRKFDNVWCGWAHYDGRTAKVTDRPLSGKQGRIMTAATSVIDQPLSGIQGRIMTAAALVFDQEVGVSVLTTHITDRWMINSKHPSPPPPVGPAPTPRLTPPTTTHERCHPARVHSRTIKTFRNVI